MKINYQCKLEEILKTLSTKPKLLLHSCCGPCSSYVLEYLEQYFQITVFYYNPNISPYEEYQMRVKEQIRFLQTVHPHVSFLEGTYEPEKFDAISKGLEQEQEGGARCIKCYLLRLEETAKQAKQLGFDYFTTTLSVSPYKNSQKLNELGERLEQKYQISYLYADFKKKNGYKRSIELSRAYNLYRQDYCGCLYSKRGDKIEK